MSRESQSAPPHDERAPAARFRPLEPHERWFAGGALGMLAGQVGLLAGFLMFGLLFTGIAWSIGAEQAWIVRVAFGLGQAFGIASAVYAIAAFRHVSHGRQVLAFRLVMLGFWGFMGMFFLPMPILLLANPKDSFVIWLIVVVPLTPAMCFLSWRWTRRRLAIEAPGKDAAR